MASRRARRAHKRAVVMPGIGGAAVSGDRWDRDSKRKAERRRDVERQRELEKRSKQVAAVRRNQAERSSRARRDHERGEERRRRAEARRAKREPRRRLGRSGGLQVLHEADEVGDGDASEAPARGSTRGGSASSLVEVLPGGGGAAYAELEGAFEAGVATDVDSGAATDTSSSVDRAAPAHAAAARASRARSRLLRHAEGGRRRAEAGARPSARASAGQRRPAAREIRALVDEYAALAAEFVRELQAAQQFLAVSRLTEGRVSVASSLDMELLWQTGALSGDGAGSGAV